MSITLNAALRYVTQFRWSVIPTNPETKIPSVPWKEYQTRLPTETELVKWFGSNSRNGIGIVTGKLSNLTALDADSYSALSFLKERNISSPISVTTQNNHTHLYFKYCPLLTTAGEIYEHLDVRSEGGFVVAPPTSGYRWLYPTFNFNSLTDLDYRRLLDGKERAETSTGQRNQEGWISEALRNNQQGVRDVTFTKIIGRLHYDGYSPDDIFEILAPHADRVSFDRDSLKRKVEYVTQNYKGKNEIKEEGSDSLADFLLDIKPVEWICKPILGKGTISFIAGLPKTMKTWLCADLAIEVSRGGKWMGKFPVTKGKVLFIDQERWKGEVQRRFKLLMGDKDLKTEDLEGNLILKSQTTTRLDLDESFNAFRKYLTKTRPDLVIIDSFATWHTKQENNRQDIQIVLERIKQLRHEFGCTILIIDHEGKSVLSPESKGVPPTAFDMVGSVGKSAAAETMLSIRKISDTESVMYHTASNLGPTIEPIKVSISDNPKGVLISCE